MYLLWQVTKAYCDLLTSLLAFILRHGQLFPVCMYLVSYTVVVLFNAAQIAQLAKPIWIASAGQHGLSGEH